MKGYYLRIKTKKNYKTKWQIKINKLLDDLHKPLRRNTRADNRWRKQLDREDYVGTRQTAREVYRRAEFELAQQGGFTRRIIRRPASRYCFDLVHKKQNFIRDYFNMWLAGLVKD